MQKIFLLHKSKSIINRRSATNNNGRKRGDTTGCVHILQVVGSMDRGGVETFLMNVLRNIDREKFKFVFLCYGEKEFDFDDEIESLNARIVRIPGVRKGGYLRNIKMIKELIIKEKIDIVHTHTYTDSLFALIAAKRAKVKKIITHAHTTGGGYKKNLSRRIYFIISRHIINKYSTDRIACGKEAGKSLFYKKNIFTIVTNGIILDNFYYNGELRTALRNELNISKDIVVLGHVGRMDAQKNQTYLIDVYEEYLKLEPNSNLLLIGDGVLRKKLENKAIALGIQDKVTFLGARSDVSDLYNVMDIFVFPSILEGMPVTLIEAQANGLPSIISDTIDKSIKLTECIRFFSLDKNANEWAMNIDISKKNRARTNIVMERSRYNIKNEIKFIEEFYRII